MKHISEFLGVRKRQLEGRGKRSLFAVQPEKGSSEWQAFNSVRGVHTDIYSVRLPVKAIVIAEPNHVLRIIYPRVRSLYSA